MTASFETGSAPRGPDSRAARVAKLPKLEGLSLPDARVVLKLAGFEEIEVRYVESYFEDFTVIAQKPVAGDHADRQSAIQLQVSRASLVQYLPQVYQQAAADEVGFLRGYLYVVQHVVDRFQEQLDHVHEIFDPRTTPPEFFDWLAGWLAIALNRDWTELQTRKMLMAATRLFPHRGTAYAISEFIRIYTGARVEVQENTWPFQGFRVGVHSTVGEDTVILPDMNLAHCFVVKLDRSAAKVPEEEIIRIHEIVQLQKPAHTAYFLAFSDEAATGQMGSFLEVGTGGGIGMGGIGVGTGAETMAPEDPASMAPGGSTAPSARSSPRSSARSSPRAPPSSAPPGEAPAGDPSQPPTEKPSS
jgi:phage tail-like protein